MQRSLFSAVSGLRNHQVEMDVIGNNIANVNTTAFKSGRATFKESFSQVLSGATRPQNGQGGVNDLEVGLGMQLASIDTSFQQGNLETTGNATDMAIQGNSFFVVGSGNNQYYTRAGNFQLDADGSLVSPTNGYIVQGRMATNGVLNSAVTDIRLPAGQTTPAKATSSMTIGGNLDASAPTITAVNPHDPTAAELADPANAQSVTQTSLAVFDSLGLKHQVTVDAWKTGANTWDYKIDASSLNYDSSKPYTFGPGAKSSPAAAATPWQFTFNPDGTIDTASSNIPAITFTPQGNGNPVSITLDPGSGSTGLTSYVAGSTALLRSQDGYASGILQSITVDHNGTITGSFTNGTNSVLAQVALADFNNPEGLQKLGDNMFTTTANSGTAVVGFSGRETASTIASGALEMSNVDLAQQFTEMIIAQRGFQANGKMITTSDDMLQELVNLKR